MRRRSERKKSVDPSPVTSSRRSSRRTSRRTPDVEKTADDEQLQNETPTKTDSSPNRASSEEPIESNKRTRNVRSSRANAKRNLRNISDADTKINAIAEEENGVISSVEVASENLNNDTASNVKDESEPDRATVNDEINTVESKEVEEEEAEQSVENLTAKYQAEEDVEMQEVNV